jgi:hypothetical protein
MVEIVYYLGEKLSARSSVSIVHETRGQAKRKGLRTYWVAQEVDIPISRAQLCGRLQLQIVVEGLKVVALK